MALNPSYEAIGKGFVQQYYALFDDPVQRPNLINMYNVGTDDKIRLLTSLITSSNRNVTNIFHFHRPNRRS